MTTQGLLRSQAETRPGTVALVDEGREPLSYRSLCGEAASLVGTLRHLGVRGSDRIAIVTENGPEFALAFLAVSSCASAVPLIPRYKKEEFRSSFNELRVNFAIVSAASRAACKEPAHDLGIPLLELAPAPQSPAGVFSLHGALGRDPAAEEPVDSRAEALVLQTSGTTGRQKIVPLTHENIYSAAGNIGAVLQLTETDRCLNVMPMQYIHGLSALLSTLSTGGSIACLPEFSEEAFYRCLQMYRPSWYTASPTIHQAVHEGAEEHRDIIEHCPLRFIRSASAAMPVPLMKSLEQDFHVPFIEAYGMTETSPQIASNRLPPADRKPGSVGRAAGPDIAVMDGDGRLQESDTVGEIVVRGANVMRGYENDPEANAACFTHGWFRTGDMGYLDADAYLFITGRKKEMINRGGEKVSPREIEGVLLEHPAVAEAVSFAVPHTRLGEEVGAAVRLRDNARASERDLRAFLLTRLADFKVPRHVLLVDAIPKSRTGKVQRIGMADRLGMMKTSQREDVTAGTGRPLRDDDEARLAQVWKTVLHLPSFNATDNFFDLGGDSLHANQILARIQQVFGVSISHVAFFEAATFEALCRLVKVEREQQGGAS